MVERDEPLVLSFAQQRLWFLSQIEGVSEAYHIPLALRLRGVLHEGALYRALDRLVQRHEALRSVFGTQDGEGIQRIEPAEWGFSRTCSTPPLGYSPIKFASIGWRDRRPDTIRIRVW